MVSTAPAPPWTKEQLDSDLVTKKMILVQLQTEATPDFLTERKINAPPTQLVKNHTKKQLVDIYLKWRGTTLPAVDAQPTLAPSTTFSFSNAQPAPTTNTPFSFADAQPAATVPNFQFNFSPAPAPAPAVKSAVSNAVLRKDMEKLTMKHNSFADAKKAAAAERRAEKLATLTADVKPHVLKLEELQGSLDTLRSEYDAKLEALRFEYDGKRAPLYKARSVIVGDGQQVPKFWLDALQNHPDIEIFEHDKPILEYLSDIKCSSSVHSSTGNAEKGFQLAFVFRENPYFTNQILTQTYLLDPDDTEDDCIECIRGTEIDWKEAQNVTKKVVQKKQKKKGKTRTVHVEEEVMSFFNYFDPPELPDDDEMMDEDEMEQLQEQVEDLFDIGCCIRDKIIPRAVAWYTGEAVDPFDDDDDEIDDYDEDEDDDFGDDIADFYADPDDHDEDDNLGGFDSDEDEGEGEEEEGEGGSEKKRRAGSGEQECKQQ